MIFRFIILILFGTSIPFDAYTLGRISKGEKVIRSERFFIGTVLLDIMLFISAYLWWDA